MHDRCTTAVYQRRERARVAEVVPRREDQVSTHTERCKDIRHRHVEGVRRHRKNHVMRGEARPLPKR